ncbi:hypothetical protein NQ176_g3813 [Zarea fungicola]|uniref:Uncharacterized protein n=1 Tax=Zarea fungicola TaxID=93591 RepID=A0ACC1NHM6_9HYPO|nr:hypothetical protein NQ176_g3813 [Lecanicillium fungicola]
MKCNTIFLARCFSVALANNLAFSVVHESRESETQLSKWQQLDKLPQDAIVPVRIALKQQNVDNGMELLMKVSDPKSAEYGQHYSADEVTELFAPSDEALESVKDWLAASGISNKTMLTPKSKGWVHFTATVSQLETALQTEYHRYTHIRSGATYFGTHKYYLPANLSTYVDFIIPAVAMAHVSDNSPEDYGEKSNKVVCNGTAILPDCIQYLYQLPENTEADPRNAIGIYEVADSRFSQDNLNLFYKNFYPRIPQGFGPQIDSIDNATTEQSPSGGETDLDVQMIMPIVYPQNAVMFQTNVTRNEFNAQFGLYNRFLDAIDGTYCTASAYGETGDDPTIDGDSAGEDCGTFKPTSRQCDEWIKLGLQGTTVVSASGDDGARGDACIGDNNDIFAPDQSSGCPYILSVGGTGLPDNYEPGDQEVAPHNYLPGGGWSNIHLRPDYQKEAVAEYFKNHDPQIPFYHTKDDVIPTSGGSYNRDGRAYPDISAISENGTSITTGGVVRNDNRGTSMSAPIVAAIFTRINEERLKAGKGFVGFVNPVLYAHPEMFNDITFSPLKLAPCNETGYLSAVKGWDPMTGLGTPNYPAMLKVFLALS